MARKKNPKVKQLENQVERLKILVNVMKDESVDENNLTETGYGVILDKTGAFNIMKLKFNVETKQSIVDSIVYSTTEYPKLMYEIQKLNNAKAFELLKLKQGEKNAKN